MHKSEDNEKHISSTNEKPLVSIVITTYNRCHLISRAIESALSQNYENIEVIVSDNFSADSTKEVVRKYLDDPRLKYYCNNANIGMRANFKKATEVLAKGLYVTYISSDDLLINPDFVSESVKLFQEFNNLKVVHGKNLSEFINSEDVLIPDYSYQYYKDSFYTRRLVTGREVFLKYPECHSVSFGGTMFHRVDVIRHKPFDVDCFSFDAVLILKLCCEGDFSFLNRDTYVALRHADSFTTACAGLEDYITNRNYIEVSFKFAEKYDKKSKLSNNLSEWRLKMLSNYFENCLRALYIDKRDEYRKLRNYWKNRDQAVVTQIEGKIKYRIFLLMNSNYFTSTLSKIFTNIYLKKKNFSKVFKVKK